MENAQIADKKWKELMLKSNLVELNRKNLMCQLFYLTNNEKQDTEVVEIEEIDFTEVRKHLERGEIIFIACKNNQESVRILAAGEETAKPWYFTHF